MRTFILFTFFAIALSACETEPSAPSFKETHKSLSGVWEDVLGIGLSYETASPPPIAKLKEAGDEEITELQVLMIGTGCASNDISIYLETPDSVNITLYGKVMEPENSAFGYFTVGDAVLGAQISGGWHATADDCGNLQIVGTSLIYSDFSLVICPCGDENGDE